MKMIVSILIALGVSSGAIGQTEATIQADSRLYEVFDSAMIERMEQENPNLVLYYNVFLSEAFEIVELPYKHESIDLYPSLDFPGNVKHENINVLRYDLDLKQDEFVMYRLGKTDYLLKFLSMTDFNEKYNEARKAHGLVQP